MFKSTVTIPNGTTATFECSTATELADILKQMGGDAPARKVRRQKKVVSPTAELADEELPITQTGKIRLRKKVEHTGRYSNRDIIEVAKRILKNIDMANDLVYVVKNYIRNESDDKLRTGDTIKTLTSSMKHYLKYGDASRISERFKATLDGAGILPIVPETPGPIKLGRWGTSRSEQEPLETSPASMNRLYSPEEA